MDIQIMWQDAQEFAALYLKQTGKQPNNQIQDDFIIKMVMDEMQELVEAKSMTEQIDACLDAVYYILDHLAKTNESDRKLVSERFQILSVGLHNKLLKPEPLQADIVQFMYDIVEAFLQSIKNESTDQRKIATLIQLIQKLTIYWVEIGIDLMPIWKLIHQANLTKFGPGGYMREDGKWMKPAGFIPPDADIEKELARQLSCLSATPSS